LATKELVVASRQRTVPHFLIHQGIFDKNDMTVVPHPLYFSLFPQLKIKLKSCHLDTIEVMEAESQTVLNTLTEHDFPDEFKKWQNCWEQCIRAEVGNFEGDGSQ
jgi:hypothetical protein